MDQVVAAYNLLLALVWMACLPRASHALWAAAVHVGASLLPLVLRRLPERSPRSLGILRDLYPILMIPAFWTEIDLLFPLRHSETYDGPISALEEALFGTQVSAWWMPAMPQLWFSELMHFSYFAYYAAIYLPPIALVMAGRRAAVRDMIFRLTVSYLACYVLYLFLPVDGPHFRLDPYEGALQQGIFYKLVAVTQAAGDSRGCAFPSSHVVGSVTIAFLAWRWLSRPVAILLTVEVVGVVCSTVYTQSHYAVDAASGVVWTLMLQLLLVPLLLSLLRGKPGRGSSTKELGRPAEIPVPVLPVRFAEGRQRWAV